MYLVPGKLKKKIRQMCEREMKREIESSEVSGGKGHVIQKYSLVVLTVMGQKSCNSYGDMYQISYLHL